MVNGKDLTYNVSHPNIHVLNKLRMESQLIGVFDGSHIYLLTTRKYSITHVVHHHRYRK